jgi:hypothetical protein
MEEEIMSVENLQNLESSTNLVIVDQVKAELSEIDALDISEHARRYENLHQKLQDTLSEIDGL